MTRVKVIGAGSIGNHLSHAARSLGWKVDLCDHDSEALERTRNDIYPKRYGVWDETISLYVADEAPVGVYDAIFIGTPPDSHLALAVSAIREGPSLVHLEKPVCPPDLVGAEELLAVAAQKNVKLTVGYDLLLGIAFLRMEKLLNELPLGEIQTIDVETREHWGGILAAHHWLDGPENSYLGNWHRGGGSAGEHSHGLNMWQHIAIVVGAGKVTEVSAVADYVDDEKLSYDKLMAVSLRTESGLIGRCIQDVVTKPARKWARVQGADGFVEWEYEGSPGKHVVRYGGKGDETRIETFDAYRPADFIAEVRHIEKLLDGQTADMPIDISRGLDTMLVIAAAHRSAQLGSSVAIDHSAGYVLEALK
ncbi:MAG: hypothetical protein CFH10_00505 [Alphaproteobacteria bacterium MarineAlpha4_Bin2]|nr:MAG: hypothetical protein CFH10_00505 [Alphaproteobacteria bacterium MarineAlpha4_Bin2]